MHQFTSLAPAFDQAILAGAGLSGITLAKLPQRVPVTSDEQTRLWSRG